MSIDDTASTVSQPLNFSDHADSQVENDDGQNGGSRRIAKKRKIKSTGKITLTSLTENNLGTLKTIILTVCDKHFSEKVYKSMLDPTLEGINKLIYYNDIPVGAILCRMMPKAKSTEPDVLEIAALAVLATYRSLGLGTALLDNALKIASTTTSEPKAATKTTPAVPGRKKATKAVLHVEEENEYNKTYYSSKCGFEVVKLVEGYYKTQSPGNAWLLEKTLTSS